MPRLIKRRQATHKRREMWNFRLAAGFLAGLLTSMSLSCDLEPVEPVEPAPSPSPLLPIPTSGPIRFGIYAPPAVPAHSPFVIVFCGKSHANEVFADDYRLGYLGQNRKSGCSQLVHPGFNTIGNRVLRVGNVTKSLEVFAFKEPE